MPQYGGGIEDFNEQERDKVKVHGVPEKPAADSPGVAYDNLLYNF